MKQLVLEAMRAGAIGFSTSTSPAHNGEGGTADALAPRRRRGAARAGRLPEEAGRGVFMLTKGGHTTIAFLEELARRHRRARWWSRRCFTTAPIPTPCSTTSTPSPRRTRAAASLVGAVSCCPLSMDFTLHSPYVFEGLESWQPALAAEGRRIRGEAGGKALQGRGPRRAGAARALPPVQRRMGQGARRSSRARRGVEQRPVGELAREAGADPLDFMLDLALEENLDTVFSALLLNSDEEAVGTDAAPPGEPGVAFRRRRAPHLLQRRRLRPASARPLGARARRAHARRRRMAPDQPPGGRVRHPRSAAR